MSRIAAALALLSLLLAPAAVAAECPRTTLADVENEVMCPVCGTPLALATEAPQAVRQREFIRRQVDDCRSKDEIKASLTAEFGDDVLALPGDDGFDLAAYIVPGLALLLGAGAVGYTVSRRRRSGPGGPGAAPATPSAASERLQADLDRYEL